MRGVDGSAGEGRPVRRRTRARRGAAHAGIVRIAAVLTATLGVLVLAASADAATTTLYASPSGSGSSCVSGSPCSLQAALNLAATEPVGQPVVVNAAAGDYSYQALTIAGGSESSLTLAGAGTSSTVIAGDGTSTTPLTISVASASVPTIAVEDVTIELAGTGEPGIAITGSASATIESSTLTNNPEGVDDDSTGAVLVENSTITGSDSAGAAFETSASGAVAIYGSTIAANAGDGIDVASSSSVELGGDLLATNGSDADCVNAGGTLTDAGYNVADDSSCDLGASSRQDAAADLGTLGSYGGPTETLPISSSSKAYDVVPIGTTLAGDPAGALCTRTDQRGVARTQGAAAGCDAGSYQYAPPVITAISSAALELGLPVSISGAGFATLTSVTFGGTLVSPSVQSNTSLALSVPLSLALGAQPITLTNPDGRASVAFDTVASPAIAAIALPPGEFDVPYSQPVPITGGAGPYSFATTSGSLPKGLSLSAGGVVTGTPTSPGGSAFGVRVSDVNGIVSAVENLSLTIAVPVVVIRSTFLKVTEDRAAVTISCKFAPCTGTVKLTESVAKIVKGRRKLITVALGSSKYATVAVGTTATVELTLNTVGRKVLAHIAKHHRRETLGASVTAGSPQSTLLPII